MTRKEQDIIEKHFDELYDIACGLNPNISDEFKVAMKAAYVAGADYAIDMFACHWISVEDELPPQDGRYIFYSDTMGVTTSYYYADILLNEHVTHWQHLPQPPSSSEFPNNHKKGGEQ